jgi:hypothetical protein
MMQGISVGTGELANKICKLSFDKGLIIETSGPHDEVVKILAPLTTPVSLLERGLDILQSAAAEVMVESAPSNLAPMQEDVENVHRGPWGAERRSANTDRRRVLTCEVAQGSEPRCSG